MARVYPRSGTAGTPATYGAAPTTSLLSAGVRYLHGLGEGGMPSTCSVGSSVGGSYCISQVNTPRLSLGGAPCCSHLLGNTIPHYPHPTLSPPRTLPTGKPFGYRPCKRVSQTPYPFGCTKTLRVAPPIFSQVQCIFTVFKIIYTFFLIISRILHRRGNCSIHPHPIA